MTADDKGAGLKRRPKTLTRANVLSALPGPKGKPVGTLKMHIRLLRSGLNVREHCVYQMLAKLADSGLAERSKTARGYTLWRRSTENASIGPSRRPEAKRRFWRDPEQRDKTVKAIRRARRTPEARTKQAEASRRLWLDSEFRAKTTKALAGSPEQRTKKAETSRSLWSDPTYAVKVRAAQRAAYSHETRARLSAAQKARWARVRAQKAEQENKPG